MEHLLKFIFSELTFQIIKVHSDQAQSCVVQDRVAQPKERREDEKKTSTERRGSSQCVRFLSSPLLPKRGDGFRSQVFGCFVGVSIDKEPAKIVVHLIFLKDSSETFHRGAYLCLIKHYETHHPSYGTFNTARNNQDDSGGNWHCGAGANKPLWFHFYNSRCIYCKNILCSHTHELI